MVQLRAIYPSFATVLRKLNRRIGVLNPTCNYEYCYKINCSSKYFVSTGYIITG